MKEPSMLPMKKVKSFTRELAALSKKRPGNSDLAYRHMPDPTYGFQRNLGNSHLQVLVGSRQTLRQTIGQSGVPTIQRKCACGDACTSCAMQEDGTKIQARLTIGAADDAYEQEADGVVDQIMRMPDLSPQVDPRQSATGINIGRLASNDSSASTSEANIQVSQSGGQPLSPATRAFMEPRFGVDFSHVRLHADEHSQQTASQIQARAFTYGHHIWLGKGESEQDKHLIAHELTHVVQQGAAAFAGDKAGSVNAACDNAKIQRDVDRQCPNGQKTVTVDLASLRGSSRNAVDDLNFANSIFRPCCVQFQLGTGVSVGASDSDTWLGGDTNLQRRHSCTDVDPEEEAMRAGATSAFGLSSRIRVFYVEDMTPTERGVSFPPFCANGDRARFVNHAYITNTGARRSLAHEFGHILLDADTHTTHPGGTDNLLEPTNTATGETLEATQCATIFANA